MLFRDVPSLLIIFVLTMPQPLRKGTTPASASRGYKRARGCQGGCLTGTAPLSVVIRPECWEEALIFAPVAIVWLLGPERSSLGDGRAAPPSFALHLKLVTGGEVGGGSNLKTCPPNRLHQCIMGVMSQNDIGRVLTHTDRTFGTWKRRTQEFSFTIGNTSNSHSALEEMTLIV